MSRRHHHPGVASIGLAIGGLLLAAGAVAAGGAPIEIEGGAYFDFVAPDPGAPAPGSITFGFSGTPEVIAADAVLVPPADTNLAFLGGGTPTCLGVTREGGTITRLAFVAECVVSGTVTFVADAFGPGAGGYLIGDRVAAPQELVEGDPAFATMIGVPADGGGTLSIIFQIDVTGGFPTSFIGETDVTGAVATLAGGDVAVGSATLPDAVIDDASRALLEEAAALGVNATVGIVGNGVIQQKGDPELQIELTVTLASGPTSPSPTPGLLPDTTMATEPASPDGSAQLLVAVAVTGAAVLLARVRGGPAAHAPGHRPARSRYRPLGDR
jgi:hypothetical protein